MAIRLKVMTFNVRTPVKGDETNYFWNRTGRITEVIGKELPDLIGFQEATREVREFLTTALFPMGYLVVGCGREKNLHGEGTVIAYRRERFELLSLESRWLSLTPSLPGSTFGGDQSGCPRILTAAVLRPDGAAEPILFLNTHLDHKGATARLLGAAEIMQYVADKGLHSVITGDMNALPGTKEIQAFTTPAAVGAPVSDLTEDITGTFHKFGAYDEAHMSKIDYIFTDLTADKTESYRVEDTPVDGVYISDHFPVVAFVEVAE